MNSSNRLITLPAEIQLLIASHLSVPEKQLLRSTCTHFRAFLPPPSSVTDLLAIEDSPYNFKWYTACPNCMRLYPQSHWLPSLLDVNVSRARTWYCEECNTHPVRPLWGYFEGDILSLDEKDRSESLALRELRESQGLERGFWDVRF